jgi:hypothetical protein
MANSFVTGVQAVWKAWKRLAHKIGNFQARVLLTIIYATVVLPFGFMVRLFSDSLQIKQRPTKWIERSAEVHDLTWARKQ